MTPGFIDILKVLFMIQTLFYNLTRNVLQIVFVYFLKGEVYDFRQKEHAIIDEFSQKAQWFKINQAV